MSSNGFQASLSRTLPPRVGVGEGTALFVHGRCRPPSPVAGLELLAAGRPSRARWRVTPGGDGAAGIEWWSLLSIERDLAPGRLDLVLLAQLRSGESAEASLGTIELTTAGEWASGDALSEGDEPLVAICMATHEPDLGLLDRQLASIRAQTEARWVCRISDDGSSPERYAAMRELIAGEERFELDRAPHRLGFYGNFERALSLAPARAPYLALADQDDRWRPHKLERLLKAASAGAALAYGDMRLVDEHGEVLADTYWTERRNNHTDLVSLLISNTITGSASLIRRELLDIALPLPPAHDGAYHDHWLALVALGLGSIAYVDEPLQDYVQHSRNVLGHAAAQAPGAGPLRRVRRLAGGSPERSAADVCFREWAQIRIAATALELRVGERMSEGRRRGLRRLLASDGSWPGAAWLAARSVRPLFGANETLGTERALARAVAWERLKFRG